MKALVAGHHTILLSNEMLAEVAKVLRYEKFQALYGFTEGELYEYVQFLRSVADSVILDPYYVAPLRDSSDLMVLQTAERGGADILCTSDGDFYDQTIVAYCAARGMEVCDEVSLLARLSVPGRFRT